MKPEDLPGLGVPLIFLLMLWIESRYAERPYEPVHRWKWLGTAFFVLTLVIGSVTPLLIPAGYLQRHGLLDLSSLGLWGVPVGVMATTFVSYWVHRAEHRFDWLWLATHQLHHSPVRVDVLGAFYAHPLEVVLKVCVGLLIGTFVLGLAPVAAAAVGLVTASQSLFQHLNIRTPRWLGFLVQRPESHCLHHERDVHSRNFSDLPLWDMVFGTFHNPRAVDVKVGFSQAASVRVIDMLLMRDVNR